MEEDILLDTDITLEGFITFYKFENEENGYRVALFKIDDNKQERTITIVGYFPHFNKDDALTLKGKLISHKYYGRQVEVVEIYKKLPNGKENIIRFLSSSNFKGIGKAAASKIYEKLGDEAISLLINEPLNFDVLLNEKILTEKQINALHEGLKSFDFTSNGYQILLRYGFSLKNIMKAEAIYNENLEKVIKTNPYQMVIDIDGIGFKTVDKLAMNMNIDPYDKRRVKAAILYCLLNYCHNSGDTYTYEEDLYSLLLKLINVPHEDYANYLNELIYEKYVIFKDDKIFHYNLYNAEVNIATSLDKFINRNMKVDELKYDFNNLIKVIQEDEGITYSDEQIDAIKTCLCSGLSIITGGPGTGKTTILNAILKILKILYGKDVIISLCAPTGRASKRMSQVTNNYACTIHRLLKWDLHSNSFTYNVNNKLKTDIIIIDEFSMVDTLLFEALLLGTTSVSQIILIGDDGQIPSVGAGNLLYDLLHVKKINKVKLQHIYRQKEKSNIVELAYNIRNNLLDESFKFEKDIKFFNIKNYEASHVIVNILHKFFDIGYTFDDIQIIIPMYGNVAGIDNINAAIQEAFNPKSMDKNEYRVNHQIFRENDRVLQLKNQPEDDVYNGDIGIIKYIDNEEDEILVSFDSNDVIYNKTTISNLTLAYAISIHKSQGSEFNHVIMCAFRDYGSMFYKQLIYTGVSRAKKSLVILGDYRFFLSACLKENRLYRKTNLINQINKVLE